jgi:hypothetical protein
MFFPADGAVIGPAESNWAESNWVEPGRQRAGHRQPQAPRAEMLQMRLDYLLADRRPVAPVGATGPP